MYPHELDETESLLAGILRSQVSVKYFIYLLSSSLPFIPLTICMLVFMAWKMFPLRRSVLEQLCDGSTCDIHVDLVEPMW